MGCVRGTLWAEQAMPGTLGTPDLVDSWARSLSGWAERDIDLIVSMTPEDGGPEASFGPQWADGRDGPQVTMWSLATGFQHRVP